MADIRARNAWRSQLLLVVLAGRGALGIWTECSLDDIVDLGPMQLESFWEEYVRPWFSLHIDSGASLEDARFFMRWTYLLSQSDDLFSGVAGDCLFGVLTVLLQALPAIDYEHGREEAVRILTMARRLLAGAAASVEVFEEARSVAEDSGWNVEAIYRSIRLYEVMLGEASSRPAAATCAGPKIYVYPPPAAIAEPPAKLLHSGSENYLPAMLGSMPLQCLFGMYGTELLFHRRLVDEVAVCGTEDPAEAELFFVPSYFKCVEVLNYFDNFDLEGQEAAALFDRTMQYVRAAGPWFDRRDGADHVFLFSWGRHPCRIPGWRAQLRSAILLQVEDHCEDLNTESPISSFSRWKDVIIPGHTDHWRAFELRRCNLPLDQRDVLVAFHGRFAGNAESYENVTVRSRIVEELSGLPGVSVGGFIEDYHVLMGRSVFCLAPRGITPWTIHLFVAILAGCIPVILSDDLEAPFQEIIDWGSFSIKWPMRETHKLYAFLESIPKESVWEMKRQVDEHACWFDYYSTQERCSPYAAVLRLLQLRMQQRPSFAGRWWRPGDDEQPAVPAPPPLTGTDAGQLRVCWHARLCPSEPEKQQLALLQMEVLCRCGSEVFSQRSASLAAPVLLVVSEDEAELLATRLSENAQEPGWRLIVLVERNRYLPYLRAWQRATNRHHSRLEPELVLLVSADPDEVVAALQQVSLAS